MPIINANTLIFDEQAFLWDFLNLFPNLKSEKSLNAKQKEHIKKAVKTGGGVWRSAKIILITILSSHLVYFAAF